MKILSFDQAATATGWSYWEDNTVVEYGVITPKPKSAKGASRLLSLQKAFDEKISQYKPDIILLEDPVGDEGAENNWKTMQVLCQVQGVLLAVIAKHNINHYIISPSSWQFTCGIHRRDRDGRKEGARKFIAETYGIKDIEQDPIDSMCMVYHHLHGTPTYKSTRVSAF